MGQSDNTLFCSESIHRFIGATIRRWPYKTMPGLQLCISFRSSGNLLTLQWHISFHILMLVLGAEFLWLKTKLEEISAGYSALDTTAESSYKTERN